jgi:hypothetical protein
VALAAGVGLAAAAVVPDAAPGAGLVVVAVGGALLALRVTAVRLRGWRLAHALVAAALVGCAAVRDAPWLVAACLLGAAVAGSLALTPARTWPGVLAGPLAVPRTLPSGARWLGRGLQQVRPLTGTPAAVGRGLVLAALLLAVFVPLLTSADAAFAELLQGLVPGLPRTDVAVARVLTAVVVAVLVGACLQLLVWPRPEPPWARPPAPPGGPSGCRRCWPSRCCSPRSWRCRARCCSAGPSTCWAAPASPTPPTPGRGSGSCWS